MIAAKIMKNYKQLPIMTKNNKTCKKHAKTIDMFEYDCSENNEKV